MGSRKIRSKIDCVEFGIGYSLGWGGRLIKISSKLQKQQALEIVFLSHSACTCYPDPDKSCEKPAGAEREEEGK